MLSRTLNDKIKQKCWRGSVIKRGVSRVRSTERWAPRVSSGHSEGEPLEEPGLLRSVFPGPLWTVKVQACGEIQSGTCWNDSWPEKWATEPGRDAVSMIWWKLLCLFSFACKQKGSGVAGGFLPTSRPSRPKLGEMQLLTVSPCTAWWSVLCLGYKKCRDVNTEIQLKKR